MVAPEGVHVEAEESCGVGRPSLVMIDVQNDGSA